MASVILVCINSMSRAHAYLESYDLLMTGDVDAVGLPVGHVPVVYIDVVRLSSASQVVPNL